MPTSQLVQNFLATPQFAVVAYAGLYNNLLIRHMGCQQGPFLMFKKQTKSKYFLSTSNKKTKKQNKKKKKKCQISKIKISSQICQSKKQKQKQNKSKISQSNKGKKPKILRSVIVMNLPKNLKNEL